MNEELELFQSPKTSRTYKTHIESHVPTYLEILDLVKVTTQPEFYFLGELKNVCVPISLF